MDPKEPMSTVIRIRNVTTGYATTPFRQAGYGNTEFTDNNRHLSRTIHG
jgi:hypothetical protein